MSVQTLADTFPDYAKDTRLNVQSVLSPEGSPGLTPEQILGTALASAYATRNAAVVRSLLDGADLSEDRRKAARAAASIMAMNNVYYRFLHLAGDTDYRDMPARLRMSIIGSPGINKEEFELYSLAVSVLNGCGFCVEAHAKKLVMAGFTKEAVQSAARIAAVMNAMAQTEFNQNAS